MELETMEYRKDENIARLTLNRPRLLNAMNYQGALDINRVAEAIHDDKDVRVVLIQGAGRAFCTGIDLKELSAGRTPMEYYEKWDGGLRTLEEAKKLVVCAMHGYALGGGLQLALASDIRIATDDCIIGLPAIREGLVPGLATLRLPRYVGLGRAKWMSISGENIDGKRAYDIGLVDHLVDEKTFSEQVERLIQNYLRVCSEGALQTKILLGLQADMTFSQFFEEYLIRQAEALKSPDHAEAMAAYREMRDPNLRGL